MLLEAVMLLRKGKVGLAVLLIAVVGLLVLRAYQRRADLQADKDALQGQSKDLVWLREENARLLQIQIDTNEVAQLRQEQRELLRLRGQVSLLNQALREQQAAPLSGTTEAVPEGSRALLDRTPPTADPLEGITSPAKRMWASGQVKKRDNLSVSLSNQELREAGNEKLLDTLKTALFLAVKGDEDRLLELYSKKSEHIPSEVGRKNLKTAFEGVSNFQIAKSIDYGGGMVNIYFRLERPSGALAGLAREGTIWLVPDGRGWKVEFLGYTEQPVTELIP